MLKHRFFGAISPLFFLLSTVFINTGSAYASGNAHGVHEKEEFNAGEMIMHHVMDAHDIHLMDVNGHALSVPLPVILYSTDGGLDVFLSSAFEHGHAEVNGYILHDGHIFKRDSAQSEVTEEQGFVGESWGGVIGGEPGAFVDLSITKTVLGVLITVVLMFIIFGSIAKSYKRGADKAPKGFQALMETLILFIRDEVAKPSIGHKYERFMPFLLTIFFFIWLANLLGLIPFIGGFNVTGNIAVTLVLAVFTFIVTTVNGNKTYWGHIFATPGVPGWLLPLMVPIEILGVFTKPLVLCLRLFANITAGHIIILSFMSLIFIFADIYGPGAGYGASIVSLLFGVFMNILELLVAFLQAYVFTLLSALYFGSAVEEAH